MISGLEPALKTADGLGKRLGVMYNDPSTSEQRRNKRTMAECLMAAGVPCIPHFSIPDVATADAKAIIEWANENQCWPIVIKPENGAASEGYAKCDAPEQVAVALKKIADREASVFNYKYKAAIAQSFIVGQEYCINTVTVRSPTTGKPVHHVTDMWLSVKKEVDGGVICEIGELLASRGPLQDRMIAYAKQVLDALDVTIGPMHLEVRVTKEGRILIMDPNPRVMGLGLPRTIQAEALEYSQIKATVSSYDEPDKVAEFLEYAQQPYERKKNMIFALHVVPAEGYVVDGDVLAHINKTNFPTLTKHKFSHKDGESVRRTIDLTSSEGLALFMSHDREAIERDIAKFRVLEKKLFIPKLQYEAKKTAANTKPVVTSPRHYSTMCYYPMIRYYPTYPIPVVSSGYPHATTSAVVSPPRYTTVPTVTSPPPSPPSTGVAILNTSYYSPTVTAKTAAIPSTSVMMAKAVM